LLSCRSTARGAEEEEEQDEIVAAGLLLLSVSVCRELKRRIQYNGKVIV